ncbi:NAD-dependent epimerase/dehydratase [Geobacter metallireducens RCH3]|uniref:NAD-dependent nucleoside diphosphate-sugar epimerase/dehydratase n=1 Tax=Geobacter metallireducens (strain ATCC 53774 / DSM 7210 / GS-15) TaxID=269799 RepID=Q39QW7_GEOMG|nr:complex I NDUFA9 subunit family protein [Geobacter metallireducens]ABB33357.1 NAD-dependent nucleoside diphosphate-sugar epimerase/dehydratase [Geobacter metallireducens GS-15]EHP85422.1 NAD-dependent epimerase/dehydratase [Geobacter metallireducens RCH3]
MKIFLTGGTGFIGGHVRKALLEAGHRIRLLVHRRHEGVEAGVEQAEGDVTRLDTFATAVEGCDATINLVGIIREFPGRGMTFDKLHVEATQNVVEAARRAGIRRHLQMSALGSRPNATSRYHQTKWRAEEEVRASGLEWTIFRPSIVFGPKDDFINKLAGYIRSYPAVPVIGDGKYRLQPVAADDVARCFVLALEKPETVGQAYELCGPDRISYNDLLDTIGRIVGKGHVPKVPNPLGIMKLVVPVMQGFSFFPITMDQITMLVEENICASPWPQVFGFDPECFELGIAKYLRH